MKFRKISEIRAILTFTEFDFLQKYRESFKSSELGRIHEPLPLRKIAEEIHGRMSRKKPQGNKGRLAVSAWGITIKDLMFWYYL